MKAVIMAGGEGTRLRPLTAKLPKPLTPVLGECTMSHIIRLLKNHGVTDTAVTLMFMPDAIKSQYNENFEGVNLLYYEESSPLGTAGSVKNTSRFLLDKSIKSHSDFFIVISGDAICDTDLSEAVKFHVNERADVTIILTPSEKPLEFGGVLTHNRESGKILTFIEKPSWSQVFTDTINTGIYIINNEILDLIPENKFYDFGKNLFPLMIRENYKMYGYVDNNYWCDIGDLDAYYDCNIDALDGKIEIIKQGPNYFKTQDNIFAGRNVKLAPNAKILPNSIVGDNCIIDENSTIEQSIIHDNVKIGRNVKIKNAIICGDSVIGDNVVIGEGCIIGQDCRIDGYVKIAKGVKIWNDKTIGEGERIMSSMIFSGIKQDLFDDDGIRGLFNETLSPEYCVKIGLAVGVAASDKNRAGRVGVMYTQDAQRKNSISKLIVNSLLCGIVASGAKSYDFGEGFEALASFATGHFRLDAMLFADRILDVKSGSGLYYYDEIKIFDQSTLNPPRLFERKLEAALSRDDFKYPVAERLYETENFEGLKFLYFSEMIKSAKGKLGGFKVTIQAKSEDINKSGTTAHIIKKALLELSAEVTDGDIKMPANNFTLIVSEDGLLLQAYDDDIGVVDFWHIIAILIKDAVGGGEREIAVPYTAPHALQIIAERAGAEVLRYLSCAFDDIGGDVKAKSKIMSQLYLKDACFAAIRLCSVLHNSKKTLSEYIKELPEFTSKIAEAGAEEIQKTKIMRELNVQLQAVEKPAAGESCACSLCKREKDLRNTEGIKLDFSNGFVHIIPKRVGGFKLIAEAVNSEIADEMLHATDDRIKSIIENL